MVLETSAAIMGFDRYGIDAGQLSGYAFGFGILRKG